MFTPRGADRLFALGALMLLLLFLVRAVALLASPYPSEYGEGTTWAYAQLLLERGTYFLPINQEPWIHGTYPPLFPRLHAALGGTLRAGRALGLMATLFMAAAVVLLIRNHGASGRRALLWGAVFLGAPAVHEWGALCRVDTLAIGLSLFGLWLAERPRGELAAAPIFALAFLAKQIALAAPAAVFITLWLRGKKTHAGVFAGLYGLTVLATLTYINLETSGQMRLHLFGYTAAAGISPGQFLTWTLRFGFAFPVLLAIGLIDLPKIKSPVAAWVVIALFTLVFTAKGGASANYLLEPSAAAIVAGAIACERRLRELPLGALDRRRDFMVLLTLQLVILCGPGRLLELRDLAREDRALAEVVKTIREATGPVLSEDLGLSLAAGKSAMLEPFQFALLAEQGAFDPAPVLADVRAGRFGVVVLGWRLARLPGLVEALDSTYSLARESGPYRIYERR